VINLPTVLDILNFIDWVERSGAMSGPQKNDGAQRNQGRRHNFKSEDTNITASKANRKILGLYTPHMTFWAVAAKRHTESPSESVTQEYACYNLSYMLS